MNEEKVEEGMDAKFYTMGDKYLMNNPNFNRLRGWPETELVYVLLEKNENDKDKFTIAKWENANQSEYEIVK